MGGTPQKGKADYFERIPPEIFSQIVQLLCPSDLASARLVCGEWNSFISATPSLVKQI